jgi:hypothetical protein
LKSNKTGKYPVENGIYQHIARFCWILVDKIHSNSGRPHRSGDLIGQIPMVVINSLLEKRVFSFDQIATIIK